MKKSISLCLFLLAACYKEHLYVQQEWVDRNFLASSRVGTPDPRQEAPPEGQRILVAWRFPSNFLSSGLQLHLTVRYWDDSEENFFRPLERSKGYAAFDFLDQKLLTYRLQVIDGEGVAIETWEHHFWTKLIDVDRSSSSVSSQPMQESVIEMP